MRRCAKIARHYAAYCTDQRVLVGVGGVFLSILFHELFHLAMHWGEISTVGLFTSVNTVVEIVAHTSPRYDIEGEEIAAYLITLLTLLATAVVIANLHDKRDERTFSDTFRSSNDDLRHLSPRELMELARRGNLFGIHH